MTDTPAYPQPLPTPANQPFLDAWRRGELHLQACRTCGKTIFFPRGFCPSCWSTEIAWTPRSGRGRIVSYALVHSHVTPPFAGESPVVLCEIALEDGGQLLARVTANDAQAVSAGLRVELVPLPEAARYPLPTFRPARL